MKIVIIDQKASLIHEVTGDNASRPQEAGLGWFDPTAPAQAYLLSDDHDFATGKRIRFSDGREVEVDCKTGDLVGV